MKKLATLLLVTLTAISLGAQAPASDVPKLDIEKYTLAERTRGDPVRGSSRAARRRRRLVPRRPRARSAGPHRLCAPVRAHDVPGLEAHRERRALPAARLAEVRPASTARRISIARTTSRRCRRTSSSWRCGSSPIAWATCSRRSIRPSCRTSRTSSATSGARARRTGHTEWSRRRCSRRCSRRDIRITGSSSDRTRTFRRSKLEDVQEFFRQYYAPNNATHRHRGRYRQGRDEKAHREVLRHAEAWTGGPAGEGHHAADHGREAARCRRSRRAAARVHGLDYSPFFKDGDADADITSGVLGQGRSSRLYKKLVYEKQIAQNVTAYQYSMMLGSIFGIEATARPGHTLQELETVINEELEAMRTKGPTAAEIERVRNVLETQISAACSSWGFWRRGRSAEPLQPLPWHARLPGEGCGSPAPCDARLCAAIRPAASARRTHASSFMASPANRCSHLKCRRRRQQAASRGAQTASINADEPWREKQPAGGRRADCASARAGIVPAFERPDGHHDGPDRRITGRLREPRRAERRRCESRSTSPVWPASQPHCSIKAPRHALRCNSRTKWLRLARPSTPERRGTHRR